MKNERKGSSVDGILYYRSKDGLLQYTGGHKDKRSNCTASLHKLAAVISWPPSQQLHRALT